MSAFHLWPYGVSIEEKASSQRRVAGKRRAVWRAFLDNCRLSLAVSPPHLQSNRGLCMITNCSGELDPSMCSGTQSCPTLCHPVGCSPPGSSVRGDSPGKDTGVGCHALFQGTFLMEGLNPRLLNWQVKFLARAPPGKPSVEFHYSAHLGLTGTEKSAE